MQDRFNTGMIRLTLGVTTCSILAACGGGNSGNGSAGTSITTPTPATATQLTGKAIDGYLAGATVCFDNGASGCDPTQPSTTTDANGNYTLKTSGDMTGRQLDVIVTPGTTDLSNPAVPFTSTFTLSAIVSGSTQNVTPLTTMVVAQTKTGKSPEQAIQAVETLVGAKVDPAADYVASGDVNTSAVAASMVARLTGLAGQGPISWSQVQATMNAFAASGTVSIQQSDVNAQLTNPAYSSAIDASTALASPLYTVDGDLMQITQGSAVVAPALSPVRENTTLSGSLLSITQEVQSNGNWSAANPVGSYDAFFSGNFISYDGGIGEYLMKADGSWTSFLPASQLHPSYNLSSAGSSLVGTDPNTNDTVTVTYRTRDVSGQQLATALQIDYRNPVRGSMAGTFPSGTTAYLQTLSYANDRLILTATGIGAAYVNGVVEQGSLVNGAFVPTLGNPAQTYTSIQQAVGTQTLLSPCDALNILPNGVAQINSVGGTVNGFDCSKDNAGIPEPVTGSWSVYPRNPDVITITFPKALGAPNVAIDDTVKNAINMGGGLIVALLDGRLLGGYMIPASQPVTVPQFRAPVTETIAASMRAAAASLGLQQNP